MKRIALAALCCLTLAGCQLFANIDKDALRQKAMNAAKDAVVKLAWSKIDKNESLSPEAKAFLKTVAQNLVDKTFDRLRAEYEKLTQEEIEKDLGDFVDGQLEFAAAAAPLALKAAPAE